MALLGRLASLGVSTIPKLVYEVGDIREVLLSQGPVGYVMRAIERLILSHSSLIVATSQAFITGYYEAIQGIKGLPYLVIENKLNFKELNSDLQALVFQKQFSTPLRIGYFGLLRCRRSWEILKKVASLAKGRVEILVRGFNMGLKNFEKDVESIPGITYEGPFISPDDLPSIYGLVDIVWACYPYQGNGLGNWRWARTNRFYEACFFHKPMLAQLGTEDGRVVEKFGLGICLDLSDVGKAVETILNIRESEVTEWQSHISRLPKSLYIYTNEHEQLFNKIKS